MKTNQRTACVNTILSVLEDNGVSYELNGEITVSEVLNDTMKSSVREILFTSFRQGNVEYKASFQTKVDDDGELKKYISGLLNNWIRKAKEFNNGQAYKAKNPGSRAGSQDAKVKEMRKLLSVTTDANAKTMIESAIAERVATIKADANTVEIDYSLLSDELKAQLGL